MLMTKFLSIGPNFHSKVSIRYLLSACYMVYAVLGSRYFGSQRVSLLKELTVK